MDSQFKNIKILSYISQIINGIFLIIIAFCTFLLLIEVNSPSYVDSKEEASNYPLETENQYDSSNEYLKPIITTLESPQTIFFPIIDSFLKFLIVVGFVFLVILIIPLILTKRALDVLESNPKKAGTLLIISSVTSGIISIEGILRLIAGIMANNINLKVEIENSNDN